MAGLVLHKLGHDLERETITSKLGMGCARAAAINSSTSFDVTRGSSMLRSNEGYAAFRLTLASAIFDSASSVFFSSWSVWLRSCAALVIPSCSAHVFSVPYRAIS
jgi:hypothetical protein